MKKTENVKLDSEMVQQVRNHKINTGISITAFIEIATKKELSKLKKANAKNSN